MKKIAVYSLVGLLILSCSVSQPNNSQIVKDSFTNLEKEYKSFSTKALSDAYVSRMFTKFLVTTPNPVQVIRQLEFARYLKDVKSDTGYFNSLKAIIAIDNSIYTKIIGTSGVYQKMSGEPATFGAFVESLNPFHVVPASFVSVQGGTFTMGSGSTQGFLPHQVTLTNTYYISKYEVTQSEWSSTYNSASALYQTLMGGDGSPSDLTKGIGASYPVNNVSWLNVMAYCNVKSLAEGLPIAYEVTGGVLTGSLLDASGVVTTNPNLVKGYRLPTEAEWEFASRGGNSSQGYLYSGSNTLGAVGWYNANSGNTIHQVGTKSPNELGLYDMSGNVYEWVQDVFEPYAGTSVINPYVYTGDFYYHALRSGSFENDPEYLRSAFRNGGTQNYFHYTLGFRVARSS